MTLEPRFAGSWVNEEHTVLGYKLRPFCLWYRFLLELTDSPFLDGKPFNFIHLYAAVRMCRLGYGDWLRARKLSLYDKARIVLLSKRYDLETEAAKFSDYLADYFAPPEFWQKGGSSDHGKPPALAALAAHIIYVTGWPEETVWMFPLGKTHWYSALFAGFSGVDLKFVSESEDELNAVRKAIAEYQEKKAARLAAKLKAGE